MKAGRDQSHWNVRTTYPPEPIEADRSIEIQVREEWYDLRVAEAIAYTILGFVAAEREQRDVARSFFDRAEQIEEATS